MKNQKKQIQTARKDLATVRAEIARLDGAFLDAFAAYFKRRCELARNVGQIKRVAGLPIRDSVVERRVHARFQRRLGRLLPETFVRTLTTVVLRSSRREQLR